ncbi:MAG: VOC family protein [Rubrivivax sp.]|nr:VOC family protein [Rubrivivax sp.]
MFDHVGLRVRDLALSIRFFERVLEPLGHSLQAQGTDYAGFGTQGAAALWLHGHAPKAGQQAVGSHLAFTAPSREAVRRFHAAGLAAGGRDNGAPGPRPDYGDTYYAAFLVDPDGNNVEAVCMKP